VEVDLVERDEADRGRHAPRAGSTTTAVP
jgi:hypothetical protein